MLAYHFLLDGPDPRLAERRVVTKPERPGGVMKDTGRDNAWECHVARVKCDDSS